MIICALDPGLVRDVGEELNLPDASCFRRTVDLDDQSLEGIVMLLAAEAASGGSSGKLYVEHLAHAMVPRFLWLAGGMRDVKPPRQVPLPNHALQRVLDRMRTESANNLNLDFSAAESGYSKSHFLRVFRAGVGLFPASMVATVTGGTGKEDVASRIYTAYRCSDSVRLFQPWALFQHISSVRRSNAQQISTRCREWNAVTFAAICGFGNQFTPPSKF